MRLPDACRGLRGIGAALGWPGSVGWEAGVMLHRPGAMGSAACPPRPTCSLEDIGKDLIIFCKTDDTMIQAEVTSPNSRLIHCSQDI